MIYTHKFIRLYYTETEVPVKFGAPKAYREKPGQVRYALHIFFIRCVKYFLSRGRVCSLYFDYDLLYTEKKREFGEEFTKAPVGGRNFCKV